MNIPPYISCLSQENYNIELNQNLNDNLSDNGFVIPQIVTANLNLISSSMPDGTFWYSTDGPIPGPIMKVNGIIVPLLTTGNAVTSVTGTINQIIANPNIDDVILKLADNLILPGFGGVTLPKGTTAQRAGIAGTIRFNTQTNVFESTSDGINWATIETSAIGVVSVSGTAGRITCSPTIGSVVVDIDSTYVGQTSIATTGIITSGTWHASTVDVAYGGTGIATTTPYSVICAGTTATGAFQSLSSLGTLGQVLTSGGPSALPGWSSLVTGVSSVTGTANQIDVSPTAGACVVSLDSAIILPGTLTTSNTVTLNGLSASQALVTDASKNIASMPYVSTIGHGGTSNIAARDVYGNVSFNSIATSVDGHAAIGTITLTIGSPQNQVFSSGSGTAIVILPDATTLITGWLYTINNNATGLIHVQASGTGTDLFTVPPGGFASTYLLTNSFTSGIWDWYYSIDSNSGVLTPFSGGTGLSNPTAHGILISEGSSNFNPIVLTAGQILIGTTAADPAAATLTPGSNISITSASGSITIAATGVITSVAGTANQIDVNTVGGVSTVSIDANYVGQSSITTLGTITSGTWNGSIIDLAHGGTNANLTANNGGIFYSTASAGAILNGTPTAGQLLLSGSSTIPAWSTSTYPSTNAINTLLYASAANTMNALATGNNGTLITSGTGVPSISSTLPATVQGNITSTGTITSGTWHGSTVNVAYGGTGIATTTPYSIICAGTTATGPFQSLASLGSVGQVLISNGASSLPSWASFPPPSAYSINILIIAGGGGGGTTGGGGGGAGGIIQNFNVPVTSGVAFTVTIGAGGAGGTTSNGNSGTNSIFGNLMGVAGGGAGGGAGAIGTSGGSGGGGSETAAGNTPVWGTGFSGATSSSVNASGGGGGGGAPGNNASGTTGGNGGIGIIPTYENLWTATAYYAGGGGGAGLSTGSTGGNGGGGNGGFNTTGGTNGSTNTGGGGGASWLPVAAGGANGGNGGSGFCAVWYLGTARGTGGTITTVTYGVVNVITFTVHIFTSSGTYTS